MKVVVQRVKEASVKVDNKLVNEIGKGFMLLVSFTHTDTINEINYMVKKIANLRIFDDENGVMNKNIKDIDGCILSISQFTLYADTKKGNRPSYKNALSGDKAKILYEEFNKELKKYIKVEEGIFASDMNISLVNIGPTTILLER